MNNKHNIHQSIFAFLIVLAILLPSGASLVHSFENHSHFDLCDNPSDVHVHKKQLDCDLELITINKEAVFAFAKAVTPAPTTQFKTLVAYKQHLYTSTLMQEPSRGPPVC